jgi:hypothetical protein
MELPPYLYSPFSHSRLMIRTHIGPKWGANNLIHIGRLSRLEVHCGRGPQAANNAPVWDTAIQHIRAHRRPCHFAS